METREERRCQAMAVVFKRKTDILKQELELEITDLNSKLFSKGLISETVKYAKSIDTTLDSIRSSLKNKAMAEKTFEGFKEVVSDISSKSHLATQLSLAIDEELKEELVYGTTETRTPRLTEGGLVTIENVIGRREETIPANSAVAFVCSAAKLSEKTTGNHMHAAEDSAISSCVATDIEKEFVAVQPTDDERPDLNGVMKDSSGTLMCDNSIRLKNQLLELELFETRRRLECARQSLKMSEKRLSCRTMELSKKGEELEEFDSFCKVKDAEFDSLHQELICVKKENIIIKTEKEQQTEIIRQCQTRLKDQIKTAQEKETTDTKKAEELAHELELSQEKNRLYEEEIAQLQLRNKASMLMAEKHKQSLTLLERKAEELEQKLKTTKEETQEYMQAADHFKEMAAKYKLSAKHTEERVEDLVQQLEAARYERRMVGRTRLQAEDVEQHPVNTERPNKPRLRVLHKNQQQRHKELQDQKKRFNHTEGDHDTYMDGEQHMHEAPRSARKRLVPAAFNLSLSHSDEDCNNEDQQRSSAVSVNFERILGFTTVNYAENPYNPTEKVDIPRTLTSSIKRKRIARLLY